MYSKVLGKRDVCYLLALLFNAHVLGISVCVWNRFFGLDVVCS
jgi:hypothetical protein